jgi:hypothetical protein
MPINIVYFDLETQRSANDVGGWNNKGAMGMSIGVTYSTQAGKYVIYSEARVGDLMDELVQADVVVGFNHISFDYAVLEGYRPVYLAEQCVSLDLMVDIEQKIGHRLKLESIASASLGKGKSAQGLDAIRWWQEGRILDIAEYCCYDVKVTKAVHEYGVTNGFVKYLDRFGSEQKVEVDWKLG